MSTSPRPRRIAKGGSAKAGVVETRLKMHDRTRGASYFHDLFCEVKDGHFLRIAEVHWAVFPRGEKGVKTLDEIRDVAEASCLLSIAINCHRLAI